MNPDDQINLRTAYAAMYRYLERIYETTGANELGALLGSMSLLPDGQTADPGAWTDWVRAVEEAIAGKPNLELHVVPDQKP